MHSRGKSNGVFLAERSLFNNMVVLSRAFWVQTGSDRDVFIHVSMSRMDAKNVSAKQTSSVVEMSVGVSPGKA